LDKISGERHKLRFLVSTSFGALEITLDSDLSLKWIAEKITGPRIKFHWIMPITQTTGIFIVPHDFQHQTVLAFSFSLRFGGFKLGVNKFFRRR